MKKAIWLESADKKRSGCSTGKKRITETFGNWWGGKNYA